ncbi:MAG: radical SAM protein [Planctomycetes bacterium]|nr:radical SAM protein [Planctomycetota bacterium]
MIQRERFPVTLVFPPQGHFTQPYLALPCLKAWLEANGFDDVEQLDLSVEAYDAFLSPRYLERCAARVRDRLPLEGFAARDELRFEDMAAFRAAAEAAVSAKEVVARIEDAKAVLRGEACFDPERYVPAVRTLYHGLRLVSAAHFPSQLTPHNFTMRYANDRSAEVLAATRDEEENPFLAWFQNDVLPRLLERRPKVLGMSVIYGSQLIPALTLGRLVKEALPDCHVTAGGGFLAYIGEKLMKAPGVDACLDSMIFHEGEAPLQGLCEVLRDGGDLAQVGSLTWFDRSGATPRAVANPSGHPVRLEDAPLPSFDGLPLELYFAPELVLPYDLNRGCYYGECTFCTLPTVIGPGYRTRSAKRIVDHVLELKQRHGCARFSFVTDCMPPGMIRDLPQELVDREADVKWWCDARIERKAYDADGAKLLYASGCRKLLFGFETATPRLLKLMKKGQSLEAVSEVAHACNDAGISVTFYAMVGFPSETLEEARATLDFLRRHAGVVREVSLQTFHIDEVAQTYREPETFGIEILSDPEADLQLYHDYRAEVGMTQEEAAEMFEELMAGFRDFLPIFAGDNLFYFMQKSHYFLHLARGTTPDEFAADCLERAEHKRRAELSDDLVVGPSTHALRVPFDYSAVLHTLATPLARAARPDFLTGRFVHSADEEAKARLAPLAREERVLVYDGAAAEFLTLRPDGLRALEALRAAGDLGRLRARVALHGDPDGASRAGLDAFATELRRAGVLRPSAAAR